MILAYLNVISNSVVKDPLEVEEINREHTVWIKLIKKNNNAKSLDKYTFLSSSRYGGIFFLKAEGKNQIVSP